MFEAISFLNVTFVLRGLEQTQMFDFAIVKASIAVMEESSRVLDRPLQRKLAPSQGVVATTNTMNKSRTEGGHIQTIRDRFFRKDDKRNKLTTFQCMF